MDRATTAAQSRCAMQLGRRTKRAYRRFAREFARRPAHSHIAGVQVRTRTRVQFRTAHARVP
jgi:hypothetical protein